MTIGDHGGALDGLRVVDLSSTLSGIMATQILADHGAEVIGVERPGGHPLRSQPSWPMWARGRQSIVADLHDPADLEVVRALCAGADVVLDTFRPGVTARFGLDHATLSSMNPALVCTSITGFGRVGRYARVKAYEAVVLATTGAFTMFGPMTPRPGPKFASVPYASFAAAQNAVQGTLAALHERAASGLGQQVDTTLLQGMAALDTWNWFTTLVNERYPGAFIPSASIDENLVPISQFAYRLIVAVTKDGHWLQFSQSLEPLFRALLRAIDLEWLRDDLKWKAVPNAETPELNVELIEMMLNGIKSKTLAEWQAIYEADRNVWGEIFHTPDSLMTHPQFVHEGALVTVDDPDRGPVLQLGPFVRMDGTPPPAPSVAPRLDEHGEALRSGARADATAPVRSPEAGSTPSRPLDGVTVLELGILFAAPYGATILADLGARVLKIEPVVGDPIRHFMEFPEVSGIKVLQGKESVAVDISTPEGKEIIYALARRSDLVLNSFRAGVAERLGFGVDDLRAINPDLVYQYSPGYGTDGPCGDRPAFAPTISAGAGIARRNIQPALPPLDLDDLWAVRQYSRRLGAGGSIASIQPDGLSALGVATGLMLGLVARDRGAGGQRTDTTMLRTSAFSISECLTHWEGAPPLYQADPDLYGVGPWYRLYEAAQGWIFLAAPDDDDRAVVATTLVPYGLADGLDGSDLEVAAALSTVFASRPAKFWEDVLLAADIACVVVSSRECEVTLRSEEFGAVGLVCQTEHAVLGEHPRLSPLIGFGRSDTVAGHAPAIGEHTAPVLREIGYTDEQIADLATRGVIATA